MATGHPSTDEMIKARGKVDSNCFFFFCFFFLSLDAFVLGFFEF